ncbi:hypothetical protein EAI_09278 [Harpegnathos saltator]|uniref:DUF7043 domain-containing protein n=1 Tax=Harpegnathos saltator TaxID=610380 RepID=E2BPV2_HARSA|nr:hypothetical protein EAI_09278 [Harpegnathos saltator]
MFSPIRNAFWCASLFSKNGYVCIMFHRRDEHVIEMQLSEWGQQSDDICNSSTFNSHSMPYTTFITSDPMTRQCPNLGRYEIVSLFRPPNADNVEDILAVDGEQNVANAAEVHDVRMPSTPFPRQCHHGSVRRLDIGCRTPDRMEFATSCSDEALSGQISSEFIQDQPHPLLNAVTSRRRLRGRSGCRRPSSTSSSSARSSPGTSRGDGTEPRRATHRRPRLYS